MSSIQDKRLDGGRRSASLSRRQFLRGTGVAIGLPVLISALPRDLRAEARGQEPQRFAFIYTPNGYNQATFVPEKTGRDWELTPALAPLGLIREHVTLVTGLDRTFVGGTGVHAQCGSCWLTSSPPNETLDGGFPTNTTLDQLLARQIGQGTRLPSLELSCNDFADNKETKYFESISWYAPGYAAATEKNPRNVFQRLFGKPASAETKSVLDVIAADAADLSRRLSRDDRNKLDEYLTSVRETERRIERAEKQPLAQPLISKPGGIPEKRGDYLRLMADLVILAFQQDLTRVATLVVDPERWDSPRMFHDVFEKPQNHHVLTHTKGDEAKAKLTQIDRFHVAFYTYMVERLLAVREGDRSLLDSSCIVMGSGISDGDKHNYRDLEVLIAGRAGGRIAPGRHLHYAGERPLADLWLSLAGIGGVQRKRFADSTGPLTDLDG